MPSNPNKLIQFWRELKRRRVVHVITVYASAAFVIIELINNLAEPLNLPENLDLIVIILLAVAFPLVVVLSWLYDLTSRGIEKTKPPGEEKEEEAETRAVPNAWKIATIVSFAVIIGLVTFHIVGGTRGLRPGDIQSLAILPFNNFTGDDQLDWVAAGMHSSLIGDMGKVSGLRVLGQTTSNAYRETDLTAIDIAKKHNVEAMVESTLTCYGEVVCVQVKVITPYPEEKVLWVEDYMEEKSQILNLYNRMTREIADELKVHLTPQEETRLAEARSVKPDAYDAYLKGIAYLNQFKPESWSVAMENFEKAIEIEPGWAAPYAGLAEVGIYMNQVYFGSESDRLRLIYENLNKALDLDPNSAEAHHVNAVNAAWVEFDWKKAEKEFLKAIHINPSLVRSHSFYAHVLTIQRRTDEALHHGRLSQELEPEDPFTLGLYAVVLFQAGKCQEALFYLEKGLSIDPGHPFCASHLYKAYICLGDYDQVFEYWKGLDFTLWEEYELTDFFEKVFREGGLSSYLEEAIKINEEEWAKNGQLVPWRQAENYFYAGKYDQAMDYYEIVYENNMHDPKLPYISCKSMYDRLKGNPRYLELLKKINLPVD